VVITTERPATAEELASTLWEADQAGQKVAIIGGGRASGMGGPLERADLRLETSRLNRVLEHSQADLTCTVEAGVTLEALQEHLGKAGQFVPLDPFNSPGHTVGGVLAAGWSGPLRLRYGSPREFVIGLRVALPDGRLAASGGRVVKNVSGYDLAKLHLGALGALGVIVAASFKVYPRPAHELTLEARPGGLAAAWREAERALALKLPPIALELSSQAEVRARLGGNRVAVERMAEELGWMAGGAARWERDARTSSETWARISVPPSRLRGALERLPAAAGWIASPGVGVAHWLDATEAGPIREARAAAEAAGGSLVLLAGTDELKREVGAWGTPPPTRELMHRLRDAFDPRRTLNPGRFFV